MAHTRPFMNTGVALASAAAIAAGPSIVMAGSPTPVALSTAKYQLTALADVTIEGITGALLDGWGGFIGPDDVFYPGTFNNDVKLTGGTGLAYYLADQALDGIAPYNLENYFFEVGSLSPSNTFVAGLGAVAYVGVGSTFGVDSLPAQLVKAITTGSFDLGNIDLGNIDLGNIDLGNINIGDILGGIDLANLAPTVLALAANIPVIGPLASVYLTGQAPGDATVYGTGLAGVAAYAQTALPGISDLINVIGAGGKDHADDESDDADETEAHDDAYETETDDDAGESGKSHGKVKSAASLASDLAVADVADAAPAVSAPAAESAGVETDAEAGKKADITVDNSDDNADVSPASKPATPKRGFHRAAAADKASPATDHPSKRTASRPSRSN